MSDAEEGYEPKHRPNGTIFGLPWPPPGTYRLEVEIVDGKVIHANLEPRS